MSESTFPLIIGLTLSIACGAYLVRNLVPRFAHWLGWSSGLVATLAFVAMVAVDAFQPELPGILQDLAMPAPAVRTTAYWTAFSLHVAVGMFGAACCVSRLTLRPSLKPAQDEL